MRPIFAALLAVASGAISPAPIAAQTHWQPLGQLETAPGEHLGPLTVSPGGDLVAGSLWSPEGGFRARVWSLRDGLAMATLDGVFPSLLPIRFAQPANTPGLISAQVYAHSRRHLRSWTLSSAEPVLDLGFEEDFLADDVLYDPFRQTFIVAGTFGPLWVYGQSGAQIATIETDAMRPHGAMTLSQDGSELVVDSSGFTLTYQMSGAPYQCTVGSCAQIYAQLPGSYGPYEALLAVDPLRQRLASLPPIDAERLHIGGGNFHPVATPTVRLWEALEGWNSDTAPVLTLEGFAAPLRHGAFSADGAQLLTLDESNNLAIWNAETGAQLMTARGIIAAQFIPGGKTIVVHAADRSSAILDIGSGDLLQPLPPPSENTVIAPDGQTLITYSAGRAGPARVWRRR
ncbi:WD40 repeat domain-containing protein [Pararhodobacter oceanensis]|uniref:WD40 repeat domain-containing protein n=1 Tax=Pararhodobacter oceanensis TaxID=2172121 RepID=UPI003A923087